MFTACDSAQYVTVSLVESESTLQGQQHDKHNTIDMYGFFLGP